jgi:methylphosphotriester-DNA--protein-cysteine methyltransferase
MAIVQHTAISDAGLLSLIKQGKIHFGGNRKLKIYGLLQCKSGKRMKRENRIFFSSIAEAVDENYRPCGNCMREEYRRWKANLPPAPKLPK